MPHWALIQVVPLLLVLVPPAPVLGRRADFAKIRRANLLGRFQRNTRIGGSSSGTVRPAHSLFIRHPLPEVITVTELENKVLDCEAGGNPPPTIHWLKDGYRITQGAWEVEQGPLENDGNEDVNPQIGLSYTKSRLFLDCVEPRDSAVYTCVAENPYFRDSTDTVLHVEESLSLSSAARCLAKKSYGSPARVHMWTRTRLENQGSDVQLFCRSAGHPQPEVTWRGPDNTSLSDNAAGSRFQILPSGDLIIRNIRWTDMGDYTCVSHNSHGTDSTVTFLYPTRPEEK